MGGAFLMNPNYISLVEKEAMWARMLEEVLTDNHIPCISQPVYGAGFTLKTGTQERLRILVPAEYQERATVLLHELFPSEDE